MSSHGAEIPKDDAAKSWTARERAVLARLGSALRNARARLDLTIAEAAVRADLDASFLGELERGRKNVSVIALDRLCRVLNVDVFAIETGSTESAKSAKAERTK